MVTSAAFFESIDDARLRERCKLSLHLVQWLLQAFSGEEISIDNQAQFAYNGVPKGEQVSSTLAEFQVARVSVAIY